MIYLTCSGCNPNLERRKTFSASRSMSGEMKLIMTPREESRRISRACPPNKTPETRTFVSQTMFTGSSASAYEHFGFPW